MTRGRAAAVATGLLALACAGAANAAPETSYIVTGNLTRGVEVPRPDAPATARGTFVAILDGTEITWRLTFRGLSGPALQAHVHLGARGVAGPVAFGVCGPCRPGIVGRARLTSAVVRAIRTGRAYVNVHTARNPAGEIRAQLRAVR